MSRFTNLLIITMVLSTLSTASAQPKFAHPIQLWSVESTVTESDIPPYELPDPLTRVNDPSKTRITTPGQWERQRPELMALMASQMYGQLPSLLAEAGNNPSFVTFKILESGQAFGGKALRRQIAIQFRDPDSNEIRRTAVLLLYIPAHGPYQPAPAFLGLNFRGNHTICTDDQILLSEQERQSGVTESNLRRGSQSRRWPVERILDAGFALGTVYYFDFVPDRNITPDSYGQPTEGLFGIYSQYSPDQPRPKNEWGFIAGWAYGLSRTLDCLQTIDELDPDRVVVIGHSRLGKTALWAGACDTRFAGVISNNSGCGGAALNYRQFGESAALMNAVRPYWFCENFRKFGPDISQMPFDSHTLISLIAPRPVYVASADLDVTADPRGEFLATVHAQPVYALYENHGTGNTEPEIAAEVGLSSAWDANIPLPPVGVAVEITAGGFIPGHNNGYVEGHAEEPAGSRIGYHIRSGKHDILEFDWQNYIRFMKKNLYE